MVYGNLVHKLFFFSFLVWSLFVLPCIQRTHEELWATWKHKNCLLGRTTQWLANVEGKEWRKFVVFLFLLEPFHLSLKALEPRQRLVMKLMSLQLAINVCQIKLSLPGKAAQSIQCKQQVPMDLFKWWTWLTRIAWIHAMACRSSEGWKILVKIWWANHFFYFYQAIYLSRGGWVLHIVFFIKCFLWNELA